MDNDDPGGVLVLVRTGLLVSGRIMGWFKNLVAVSDGGRTPLKQERIGKRGAASCPDLPQPTKRGG